LEDTVSTTTNDRALQAVHRPLQDAAAAVTDAQHAVHEDDPVAARAALVALARASHRALAQLEGPTSAVLARPRRLRGQLAWWHQQLDEAHLQLALAEMDARDARDELLEGLERRFATVSDLISASVEHMGTALTSLRKEMQASQRHSDSHEVRS
jgi:hypothetical protein